MNFSSAYIVVGASGCGLDMIQPSTHTYACMLDPGVAGHLAINDELRFRDIEENWGWESEMGYERWSLFIHFIMIRFPVTDYRIITRAPPMAGPD